MFVYYFKIFDKSCQNDAGTFQQRYIIVNNTAVECVKAVKNTVAFKGLQTYLLLSFTLYMYVCFAHVCVSMCVCFYIGLNVGYYFAIHSLPQHLQTLDQQQKSAKGLKYLYPWCVVKVVFFGCSVILDFRTPVTSFFSFSFLSFLRSSISSSFFFFFSFGVPSCLSEGVFSTSRATSYLERSKHVTSL